MRMPPAASDVVPAFLSALHALPAQPGVFNPWVDSEPGYEERADAPAIRSANLSTYLNRRIGTAKVLLIAEAPSHRGAKFSGVPMTSERIILGRGPGVLRKLEMPEFSTTSFQKRWPYGRAEATATCVWSRMIMLGYKPCDFVLWNAYPCHPHEDGNRFSNRTPSKSELVAAAHVLKQLLLMFPKAKLVAVGQVAKDALMEIGLNLPSVRHPANGGAVAFQREISALLSQPIV
jgi:hypothetical protein